MSLNHFIFPGDYSANYQLWRDSFGATGAGLAADGNGDTVVDSLDYDLWKVHFEGQAAAGNQIVAAVPEPKAQVAVVLLALAATCCGRRSPGCVALVLPARNL